MQSVPSNRNSTRDQSRTKSTIYSVYLSLAVLSEFRTVRIDHILDQVQLFWAIFKSGLPVVWSLLDRVSFKKKKWMYAHCCDIIWTKLTDWGKNYWLNLLKKNSSSNRSFVLCDNQTISLIFSISIWTACHSLLYKLLSPWSTWPFQSRAVVFNNAGAVGRCVLNLEAKNKQHI